MSLKNEEIDQLLKDSAQRHAELDRDILNSSFYDSNIDACQKLFLKLPHHALIPMECVKLREMLELEAIRKHEQVKEEKNVK